ncbi:MAG: pyridoxal phosphate-dependent aminotransferase family protein [Alphaproteobacteria bacterium]|nr:MAG: pyridoxal phosphate-dependent aminotransferase family protein [Alphaproteobacteria bacterium]
MDLFEKCRQFDRADRIRAAGFYPYYKTVEGAHGPDIVIDGKPVIMAGSNNYLGLTVHPHVLEAARVALERYGASTCGSRLMSGTITLHSDLERRLARFLGYEDALLLATGYQTPQAIIPVLAQRGDLVLSDRDNHASIVRANAMATGQGARVLRFKHNDMPHLEALLRAAPLETPKLIATDGVFSTTGVIADMPQLVSLARRYNARIMCDDAHATGVLGRTGRGTGEHFGLGPDDIDLVMGTFSKSLASQGGFVAGPSVVIDYLRNVAPPAMFSASPPPPVVAAALAALDILEAEPERIARLHQNVSRVITALRAAGFTVLSPGGTGIVSILVGQEERTFVMAKALLEAGVFVNPFVSPGVPQGQDLIRTSFMATHEPWHLDAVIAAITRVGLELGLIPWRSAAD